MDTSYSSTYRRYKIGTAAIVAWLIKPVVEQTSSATPIKKPKRGKKSGGPTSLTCQDLIKLAEAAVQIRPLISVPMSLIRLLDKVIAAREWCQSNHPVETIASDTHVYFVTVLKDIRAMLIPLAKAPRRTTSADPRHTTTSSRNVFDMLDLQDLTDNEEHTVKEAVESAIYEQPSTSKLNMKGKDLVAEEHFAAQCFLNDYRQVREQVISVWQEYSNGKLSLITAALATDVAMDTIRRMQQDLVEDFHHLADHAILHALLKAATGLDATSERAGEHQAKADQSAGSKEDINSAATYLGAHDALCAASKPRKRGRAKGVEPATATIESSDDHEELRKQDEKYQQAFELVSRLFADSAILLKQSDLLQHGEEGTSVGFFWTDQITQAMKAMSPSHQIPTWLTLACCIMVDINLELRDNPSIAFKHLTDRCDRLQLCVASLVERLPHLAWCGDKLIGEYSKRLASIQCLVDRMVKQDLVGAWRKQSTGEITTEDDSYWLLKYQPLLCGRLMFHLQRSVTYETIQFANNCGVVPALHLYHAASRCGFLDHKWTDLEQVEQFKEPSKFLVATDSNDVAFRRMDHNFTTACCAASAATHGYRGSRATHYKNVRIAHFENLRLLETGTPLLDVVRQRSSVEAMQLAGTTSADLQRVLALRSIHAGSHEVAEPGDKTRQAMSSEKQQIAEQHHRSLQTSVGTFLEALTHRFADEEHLLDFDYLSVATQCHELSKRLDVALRAEAAEAMGLMLGDEKFKNKTLGLGEMVGLVFKVAADMNETRMFEDLTLTRSFGKKIHSPIFDVA